MDRKPSHRLGCCNLQVTLVGANSLRPRVLGKAEDENTWRKTHNGFPHELGPRKRKGKPGDEGGKGVGDCTYVELLIVGESNDYTRRPRTIQEEEGIGR